MDKTYHVKIMQDAEGQVIRIPKELEISETEMVVSKEGEVLVFRPLKRRKSLSEVLATLEPIDEEFPEIDDPPPDPVEI